MEGEVGYEGIQKWIRGLRVERAGVSRVILRTGVLVMRVQTGSREGFRTTLHSAWVLSYEIFVWNARLICKSMRNVNMV